jgi:hypothetical protein
MSVQSLNNQTLQLRELNISNEYLQGTPGFILQSNSLTTDNAGELLVNGVPISSGGGGTNVFDEIFIGTTPNPTVNLTCVNTGVLTVDGETVLTVNNADLTYETIANADATFETKADAAATFETKADAAATFETISNASSTYQTIAAMTNYLQSSTPINVTSVTASGAASCSSLTVGGIPYVPAATNVVVHQIILNQTVNIGGYLTDGAYTYTLSTLPYSANNYFIPYTFQTTGNAAVYLNYFNEEEIVNGVPSYGTKFTINYFNGGTTLATVKSISFVVITTN